MNSGSVLWLTLVWLGPGVLAAVVAFRRYRNPWLTLAVVLGPFALAGVAVVRSGREPRLSE